MKQRFVPRYLVLDARKPNGERIYITLKELHYRYTYYGRVHLTRDEFMDYVKENGPSLIKEISERKNTVIFNLSYIGIFVSNKGKDRRNINKELTEVISNFYESYKDII